ncbi:MULTISPECIES: cold shock domain-containing protein [Vibrio]|uniref:cold shock domain-containing protein n=1 Tax=Vibrio TaxID=662 RepID=UPI002074D855|nr:MULTISPECIES: cold shock domain-containing protein [Vibrio]USD35228.1 cold shock domain-containing protein [Vibrio sp. SCSIO 43186]USD48295.1 cold shock domain-containing protein [Vibrio sp. SCSIO 43145]USD72353.1 cold shock domain-containing protein [Vibrio sp. SCSIO 43139]USD98029.1 hypothetical protein CTT30_18425 [Vibrio coralliilyticus]
MLGVIVKWNAKHGYGLISSQNSPTQHIFFHIGDMSRDEGPPFVTEHVEFDVLCDMNGCKMATNICPTFLTVD